MIIRDADLWTRDDEQQWLTITTNIGWKKDGSNPMGRGVAWEAARRWPDLPMWYGERCRKYKAQTAVCYRADCQAFLFPTKPLNVTQPHISWRYCSDIGLIRRSAKQLAAIVNILRGAGVKISTIKAPPFGCGNGGLRLDDVLPVIEDVLDDDFILCVRR